MIQFKYTTALTIAGSDSCGGAGIQADLKTFSALGVYGASVITAITAQNTVGVKSVQAVTPEVLRDQLDAVFEDLEIDAVKTGMLHNPEAIRTVVEAVDRYHPRWLVVDPVMVSTSGYQLLTDEVIRILTEELLPRASIVTPNIPEAEILSGMKILHDEDGAEAIERILQLCPSVLLKGGHTSGSIADRFASKNQDSLCFPKKKIITRNTHGTGCTLSAAIAAELALGLSMEDAIYEAECYIDQAILQGSNALLGHGHGAVNHFFDPLPLKRHQQ